MIADIILGINIDTLLWIEKLKEIGADYIIVLDYDYYDKPKYKNDVLYISTADLKIYLKKFDTVRFYKSLYIFPGIEGKISN